MARVAATIQDGAPTGIVLTFGAANADGYSMQNTGREGLYVKNGSGVSINVTIQTPKTVGGLTVAEQVVAVGAGAEKLITSFKPLDLYAQADGTIYLDFSAVTTVTVAFLRMP